MDYLRGNRLARLCLFVMLPLGLFFWWQSDGGTGEVTAQRIVSGIVSEVHDRAYLITLSDGRQVRVLRTRVLATGERVELMGTTFDSGRERFALTRQTSAVPVD